MYSAFHPSGVGTMSRGDEPWTFAKGLKRIGTDQGFATSQLGVHTCHACWWQVWHFSRMTGGGQVCQGQLGLPSFRGRYMSNGDLRLARGELPGLTKGLKLGSYHRGPGGYYSGTLVMVVTAVLKAVYLLGGHTAATELLQ